MAAPLVVKSTDAGAPVVAGIDSCIIALLDQYLLPLGWEKPFSGVNKAVYRPPSAVGNRLFYQVFDGANVCGNRGGYYIRSFESMSNVDTGAGSSPATGTYVLRSKAIWGTASARPWVLIADGYGFWLGIEATGIYAGQDHLHMTYAGEGIPMWDDLWFSILNGYVSTSSDPENRDPLWPDYFSTASGGFVARDITGDAAKIATKVYIVKAGSDRQMLGVGNAAERNYPWRGRLVYTRPIVMDYTAANPRGFLPGLYEPLHSGGFTRYQVITDGLKQLMAIDHMCGNHSVGWMLIDIGEGFRSL